MVAVEAVEPVGPVRRHLTERQADTVQRLAEALGDDGDATVLQALDLAFSGAMLQAGMGHLAYEELADRMAEVAVLVVDGGGRQP